MTSVMAAPMQSAVIRLRTALLCLLATGQALTGCAEMSHEQQGAATGAGIGAVVGAVAGGLTDKKNPGQGALIGATAGALVGGAAGWAVGAYRVRQLKPREEAAAASHYTPQQGVVRIVAQQAGVVESVVAREGQGVAKDAALITLTDGR